MVNFPELITPRLKLRKAKISDLSDLYKYVNNKVISDNLLNFPHPFLEEDAITRMNFVIQGFKNKERYVFAMIFNETKTLIGEIGLHLDKTNNKAEIGYWVGEPFWSKGFASEATAAILKFGFEELNLNKIFATHFLDNPASGKVLQKNQMIFEGNLIDQYKSNDAYKSVAQYRLTKNEYDILQKNSTKDYRTSS